MTYHVFEVFDPAVGRQVEERQPSVLPCLIALNRLDQTVYLEVVRPTPLLEMFGQEDLRQTAETAEKVTVRGAMDEAAE